MIGSTQAGSISVQMPAVLNNIVGTKIRIIFGYPDGRDVNLAMERGEVEGRATNPWASYVAVDSALRRARSWIIPIIQVGMVKDPSLPNVPLLRELKAKTPADQAVLEFMSKATVVGRPIATTPGVPAGSRRRAAPRVRPDAEGPRIHQGGADPARRDPADDRRRARRRSSTRSSPRRRPARPREGRDPAEGCKQMPAGKAGQSRMTQRLAPIRSARSIGTAEFGPNQTL